MSMHYDVIIIGSGAGGGTLAWALAPSGKKILLLERGDYIPREKQNWDSHAVVVENRYHITEAWRDKKGDEFHAGAHYCVGGNTKFYGAALIRMREHDFGDVRHHGGVSPAWPIGLRRARAVLHAARSICTRCTGSAASTRRSRAPARPIGIRRSATSRAFSSWSTT